eukprot:Nk52_evm38s2152 gene=Nk52_evmTU38s2152
MPVLSAAAAQKALAEVEEQQRQAPLSLSELKISTGALNFLQGAEMVNTTVIAAEYNSNMETDRLAHRGTFYDYNTSIVLIPKSLYETENTARRYEAMTVKRRQCDGADKIPLMEQGSGKGSTSAYFSLPSPAPAGGSLSASRNREQKSGLYPVPVMSGQSSDGFMTVSSDNLSFQSFKSETKKLVHKPVDREFVRKRHLLDKANERKDPFEDEEKAQMEEKKQREGVVNNIIGTGLVAIANAKPQRVSVPIPKLEDDLDNEGGEQTPKGEEGDGEVKIPKKRGRKKRKGRWKRNPTEEATPADDSAKGDKEGEEDKKAESDEEKEDEKEKEGDAEKEGETENAEDGEKEEEPEKVGRRGRPRKKEVEEVEEEEPPRRVSRRTRNRAAALAEAELAAIEKKKEEERQRAKERSEKEKQRKKNKALEKQRQKEEEEAKAMEAEALEEEEKAKENESNMENAENSDAKVSVPEEEEEEEEEEIAIEYIPDPVEKDPKFLSYLNHEVAKTKVNKYGIIVPDIPEIAVEFEPYAPKPKQMDYYRACSMKRKFMENENILLRGQGGIVPERIVLDLYEDQTTSKTPSREYHTVIQASPEHKARGDRGPLPHALKRYGSNFSTPGSNQDPGRSPHLSRRGSMLTLDSVDFQPAKPRGRGRPPRSQYNSNSFSGVERAMTPPPPKRKRGRPPKSSYVTEQAKQEPQNDVGGGVRVEMSQGPCVFCLEAEYSNEKERTEALQAKENESVITCCKCRQSFHPSCLSYDQHIVDKIKTYGWQCVDCKVCMMCSDPGSEDRLMFCDSCDRAYHTFCVNLEEIPSGEWKCVMCK